MTAGLPAGAASHAEVDWHSVDWQQVTENVRRLQARIVKATQAGRWGKVKALQRLLTHSFSGKALAVRRVTENQGKRRSEEHTSELQSRQYLVCRLLLEKKKK